LLHLYHFSVNTFHLNFLAINELVYLYFDTGNLYHNFFVDYSISASIVYFTLHRWLSNSFFK
jgi:hypothetical protein